MMNQMMRETVRVGTAQKAQIPGWQPAGKTGTSQDFRDAWFIGFTPHLVTGVWLGNDDSTPTKKVTGGGLPVEIWSRFMKVAHQGVAVASLPGVSSGPLAAIFAPTAGASPDSAGIDSWSPERAARTRTPRRRPRWLAARSAVRPALISYAARSLRGPSASGMEPTTGSSST